MLTKAGSPVATVSLMKALISEVISTHKRSHENGTKAEKDKTERATGLGRRTKEEI